MFRILGTGATLAAVTAIPAFAGIGVGGSESFGSIILLISLLIFLAVFIVVFNQVLRADLNNSGELILVIIAAIIFTPIVVIAVIFRLLGFGPKK